MSTTRDRASAREVRPDDRRPRRRGGRMWLLGLVLVVLLAGGWTYVIYGSTVFAADRVAVTGTHRLTAAQVRAAAAVPVGTPLARVDLRAVQARVASLVQVAAVKAYRDWPDTVHISVRERVPVAAVQRNGAWWLVDRTAVVVARSTARPQLPALSVANPEPDDAATRSALAVVVALPRPLARQVHTVSAATPDSVSLQLAKHVVVVWGNADRSDRKARVFTTLRKAQPHGRVYDVSSPDVATVRR
ncbi:MAG: FtsQ-type POTRA domain-containing protein [Streptosporangiales bacterium]|nr:FtsQ-type POTRA domain-containing protein [Streptosporangiales bacterium]MBO0891662.1 FtsQ-type POTRA domain-containing protein [Acidothermales bacterium]